MRPFWIHQLAEYLIGIALIAQGLQSPEPLIPVVIGIIVIANIAVARGPLGAFRWVGRKIHRWLDLVVIALLAGAVVQPWVESDSGARVTMAMMLAPIGFLWFYTDWAEKKDRKQRRTEIAGPTGASIGRNLGRIAGNSYVAVKRRSKSE